MKQETRSRFYDAVLGRVFSGFLSGFLFGAICIVANGSHAQEVLPPILDEEGPLPNENLELLTRGPLHEAFATSAPLEPQPGIVVQKKPPVDIQELPPTYEPAGGNEQKPIWIPGYWSWDDDREDYIWVSGAWRISPEDRRWVPGYWNETTTGWQWVSGFWASAEVEQLDYVKPPPPTLEAGPSIPAPSQNHFWIPGTWVYQSHAYNWRPGYWCPFEEHRVWVPAHYVWTPSGCLFVNGYWDYVLHERGYLYAPVYFHHPVVYYRPSCGIRLSNLLLHLFVSRHHHHYFFGDYYGHDYRHRGRYPLFQYHLAARHYDPLLTYYDVHYGRHGIDGRARLRGWHNYYSSHAHHRPPRTWSAQRQFARDKDAHRYRSRTVLAFAPKPHGGGDRKARHDGRSERDQIRHEQFREIAKQRKDVEARNVDRLVDSDERARHLKLPRRLRTNTRNGELGTVTTGGRERTGPRENRMDTSRAGIRASSFGDQREIGSADRKSSKRGKKAIAGKGRNRLDGPSQGTIDVGPKVGAALQDRGQLGESLRSRANNKSGRQLDAGKNRLSLDPPQGPSTTAKPQATRRRVEQAFPRRAADATHANNATAEKRASSDGRRATNKASSRTENRSKREVRKPKTSVPATSQRAAVEQRQPTRTLRLSNPQTNAKSRAKSTTQSARPTHGLQQRSSSRGDSQRQPDVGRSRQKATSATSSQQTTSRAATERRQPDFERVRQKATSARSSQQTITRPAPQQRQPVRARERSAPKPRVPARTKSATTRASSSRNTQQRSSFSSRDVQRQSGVSSSRRQPSSNRAKRPSRAQSYQPSSSRSRASSARSTNQSRQPNRQSVSRQSSNRQKNSGNRQFQSKPSSRSAGRKKN